MSMDNSKTQTAAIFQNLQILSLRAQKFGFDFINIFAKLNRLCFVFIASQTLPCVCAQAIQLSPTLADARTLLLAVQKSQRDDPGAA